MFEKLATGKHLEFIREDGWEYVRRTSAGGAVIIVALTAANRVLLVEQARPPIGTRCIEFPAGLLGGGDEFVGEPVSFARFGGAEKSSGTLVAEFFTRSLHRDERHTEGAHNLALRSITIGDELAGEEAERSNVIDRMTEDRQVAVEVVNGPLALLKGEFLSNGGATRREDRQLDLRHGRRVNQSPPKLQPGSSAFPARCCFAGRGQDV